MNQNVIVALMTAIFVVIIQKTGDLVADYIADIAKFIKFIIKTVVIAAVVILVGLYAYREGLMENIYNFLLLQGGNAQPYIGFLKSQYHVLTDSLFNRTVSVK